MKKGRYDFIHLLLAKTANELQKDFIDNPHGWRYFGCMTEMERLAIMHDIKTMIEDFRKHSDFLKHIEAFMDLEITIKQLKERIWE